MYLYVYKDMVVCAERRDSLMNDPEIINVISGQHLVDLWACQEFLPQWNSLPDQEKLEILAEVYGGWAELADLFLRLDNPLA